MGSPPRMRGKLVTADFDAAMDGITPAHAGKTRLFPLCNYYNEDHPRACGENFGVCQRQATSEGSPPRMRGKLDTPAEETETDRITPAHAGKTAPRLGLLAVAPDHPRACGENLLCLLGVQSELGSPPRMRGKLIGALRYSRGTRITPAHAGKTYP